MLGLVPLVWDNAFESSIRASSADSDGVSRVNNTDINYGESIEKIRYAVAKDILIRLDNTHNPQHCNEQNNGGENSCDAHVVIGRAKLLKSFHAACNEERKLYRDVHLWALRSLSRRMLRFSKEGGEM